MSTNDNKRQRTDTPKETTLIDRARKVLNSIPYSKDLASFAEAEMAEEVVYGVLFGAYKADLAFECSHFIPTRLRPCSAERDNSGRIISVSYKGQKLEGLMLKRILAAEAAKAMCGSHLIFEEDEAAGRVGGFVIPYHIQVEATEKPVGDSSLTAVHYLKSTLRTVLKPEDIEALCANKFAHPGDLAKLARELHSMKQLDNSFELDASFEDSAVLHQLVVKADERAKVKEFCSTLLASSCRKLPIAERFEKFLTSPTQRFATALKLRPAHAGKLVSLNSRRELPMVNLSDLSDTDEIFLSSVPVDPKAYQALLPVEVTKVYQVTEDAGIIAKGRPVPVKNLLKLQKSIYVKFLQAATRAKATENTTTVVAAAPASADEEGETFESIKIDL